MGTSRWTGVAALAALGAATLAGCLGPKAPAGPERSPGEIYAAALGANAGLTSLRSVVEARLSYAGRRISLPGVLLLDTLGGFRLDLLSPLDRPVAMIFSDEGRVVQYRPGTGVASSLGVFPGECRDVAPHDWVAAVLASSSGPPAGERLSARRLFRGDRVLERWRDGALYQSIRLREEEGLLVPRVSTWYCDGEPVLEAETRGWVQGGGRRLPSSLEISYVKAGLTVALELREIEGNPSLSGSPIRPRLAEGTRWSSWRLP